MSTISPPLMRPRRGRADNGPIPERTPTASQQPNKLLLPLLLRVLQAPDTAAAARVIAEYLPPPLQGCRLAVGRAGSDGTCRLLAVTGRDHLDHRSERVRALEAALDESILSESPMGYARNDIDARPAKTYEQLARLSGSDWVQGHALHDGAGHTVGAWLMWGDTATGRPAAAAWLSSAAQPVATALQRVAQAHQGAWTRCAENLRNALQPTRNRRLWTAIVFATVAVLAIPVPYRIRCGCILEPVTRRYIAAPFDATLAQTLVKPGDVVTAGQPLVELDGREIVWELASLQAAYEKAQKERDTAMADRKTLEAQLARLEMEQLEHQIALLKDRQQHLKIASPFRGVVISGDLQRVEGAPVSTGQTLLEVAPLDKVVVELAVPERSITHLRESAQTSVQLDAFPGQSWQGKIATIHPRAELRDAEQVFVAELEIVNRDGNLRPGMRGRGKLDGGWAASGWILFHRPYYALVRWLGWS